MTHRQQRTRTLVRLGELVLETDPGRPSGRLLRQAGMDASYVDLADPAHLEFDYMRWLRIVLRVAGAKRVLHVGGGGCALARALAAADPGSRQEVCEVDAEVIALAREHLGLRRAPGLRIRHAEGREFIATQRDASWEAIVIDAFVGARVPSRLVTVEALREAARVAPLTVVNVVDNRSARDVRAIAAAMARAYPRVWTLGHGVGNTIVGGCRAGRAALDLDPAPTLDLDRLAVLAAADPSPPSLTRPERLAQLIAGVAAPYDSA